jgi:hypothetical protein
VAGRARNLKVTIPTQLQVKMGDTMNVFRNAIEKSKEIYRAAIGQNFSCTPSSVINCFQMI